MTSLRLIFLLTLPKQDARRALYYGHNKSGTVRVCAYVYAYANACQCEYVRARVYARVSRVGTRVGVDASLCMITSLCQCVSVRAGHH